MRSTRPPTDVSSPGCRVRRWRAFFFLGPTTVNITPPAPAQPSPETETVFWQSIAQSSNAADFDEYLRQYPEGRFAGLAHNLVRWVLNLGLGRPSPAVVKTVRMRLIAVPGRLTSSARKQRLALPTKWPWRQDFLTALAALRRLPIHI